MFKFFCFIVLFIFHGITASHAAKSGWEVSPSVVFYSGDALRASVLGGASAVYRFNESFWVGGDFYAGPASVDEPNGFRVDSKDRFFLGDTAFYWNLPAELGRNSIRTYADLYTSIGLGYLSLGPHLEPYGFIGGGLVLHTGWKGLGFRFDLKNLFFVLDNDSGSDFNSDMLLSIGLSWIFF